MVPAPPLLQRVDEDLWVAEGPLRYVVVAWDFDRVVVGHGEIIESGGREAFAQAWAWL